jgi:hypothetical protein
MYILKEADRLPRHSGIGEFTDFRINSCSYFWKVYKNGISATKKREKNIVAEGI